MLICQEELTIETSGRGSYELTALINDLLAKVEAVTGICHLFIKHTSASLMICENQDPSVRVDLETFMSDLVPDGDSRFIHTYEGPDDMPAHVRSVLTQTNLSIPITSKKLALGTWQGVYLWEHRLEENKRTIVLTIHS